MTSVFSWQNSISLCPASFRNPRPNLLLQVFLDSLLLHSSPLWWKGCLFWVLVLEGLAGLHSSTSATSASSVPIIREMQIKTTMRYHFTLVIIKESTNNKCWIEYREERPLLHCWWKCKLVQPLWKIIGTFLKNQK